MWYYMKVKWIEFKQINANLKNIVYEKNILLKYDTL